MPALGFGTYRVLGVVRGPQPEAILWLVYEVMFVLLALGTMVCLVSARVGIERAQVRRYARTVLVVVVTYYMLWAVADVIILAGYNWGWGVRIVPNVLYYGGFVPVAYVRFFPSGMARASRWPRRRRSGL